MSIAQSFNESELGRGNAEIAVLGEQHAVALQLSAAMMNTATALDDRISAADRAGAAQLSDALQREAGELLVFVADLQHHVAAQECARSAQTQAETARAQAVAAQARAAAAWRHMDGARVRARLAWRLADTARQQTSAAAARAAALPWARAWRTRGGAPLRAGDLLDPRASTLVRHVQRTENARASRGDVPRGRAEK